MPYPLLKALHYFGLALLLGGPLYAHFLARPGARSGRGAAPSGASLREGPPTGGRAAAGPGTQVPEGAAPARLNGRQWALFGLGLALFLATGYMDAVRAAGALWGQLQPGDLEQFLLHSRYGQVVLRKSALALAWAGTALLQPSSPRGRGVLLALGLGVVYHISTAAHSASNGALAFAADVVHVAALSAWGGGLLYFAAARWPRGTVQKSTAVRPSIRVPGAGSDAPGDFDVAGLAALSRRFGLLGAGAVAALTVTGMWMASRLIYGLPAVTGTPYGMALVRKVAVFGGILALAGANRFYFTPGVERGRSDAPFLRLYRLAVRAEAALLLLVLVGTGSLTTHSPPKEPQALPAPMTRRGVVAAPGIAAGDEIHYVLDLVPHSSGRLAFELELRDGDGRPVAVKPPFMDLTMPDHLMPPYGATLRAAGPGVYRADLVLPMSGFWRVFIPLHGPGAEPWRLDDVVVEFKTAKSPREQQLVWYVSHYRVTRHWLGVAAFMWWSGLLALGVFGWRRAGRAGRHKPLRTAAGLLVFFASWQVASMFVAKSWPTEHKPNPVPVTAAAIDRGKGLFMANCASCHGVGGQGDGPLRETMWPPPSDLTIYTSWHADGELYWFITKGVAGTDMPAFEGRLPDEERWTIIHFLRTLPPREGPYADWYPGYRQYFLPEWEGRD